MLDLDTLELILLGPVLRRVTERSVCVFVALKTACRVTLELWDSPEAPYLGDASQHPWATAQATTRFLGPHVHVTAVEIQLAEERSLQLGHLYGYNLRFQRCIDDDHPVAQRQAGTHQPAQNNPTPPTPSSAHFSPNPSSDRSSDRSSDPSSDRSPNPSSDRSSDRSPDPSSDRSPNPSSDRSPDPSSDRSPDPSSDRSPNPSSDRSPNPSSDRSSDRSPDPSSDPPPELVGCTEDLASLGLLAGEYPLGYEGDRLPSFALPSRLGCLQVAHGSCRKPHGLGADMLAEVDHWLAKHHRDPDQRPHILVQTGDQIYADDVALGVLVLIQQRSQQLFSWFDPLPNILGRHLTPQDPELRPGEGRRQLVTEQALFSSGHADGHLVFLTEFFTMYLLVGSPVLWPKDAQGQPTLTDTLLDAMHQMSPANRRIVVNQRRDRPPFQPPQEYSSPSHPVSRTDLVQPNDWGNLTNIGLDSIQGPGNWADPATLDTVTFQPGSLFSAPAPGAPWGGSVPSSAASAPQAVPAQNPAQNPALGKPSPVPDFGESRSPQPLPPPPIQPKPVTPSGARSQRYWLGEFLRQLPRVRRALANVPSMAIFDDHEVTDDWNLHRLWVEQVYSRPTGRHILRNALAAYAVFQDWGNRPEDYAPGTLGDRLLHTLTVAARATHPTHLTQILAPCFTWFRLRPLDPQQATWPQPTHEPIQSWHWRLAWPSLGVQWVALDTRTCRAFPRVDAQANPPVTNEAGAAAIAPALLDQQLAGLKPQALTFVISASPILGLPIVEFLQQAIAVRIQGTFACDNEAWSVNRKAREYCLTQLANLERVVILSGDVHYGFSATASYISSQGQRARLVQLCASALKNTGKLQQILSSEPFGHRPLGWMSLEKFVYLGFDRALDPGVRRRLVGAIDREGYRAIATVLVLAIAGIVPGSIMLSETMLGAIGGGGLGFLGGGLLGLVTTAGAWVRWAYTRWLTNSHSSEPAVLPVNLWTSDRARQIAMDLSAEAVRAYHVQYLRDHRSRHPQSEVIGTNNIGRVLVQTDPQDQPIALIHELHFRDRAPTALEAFGIIKRRRWHPRSSATVVRHSIDLAHPTIADLADAAFFTVHPNAE